MMAIGPDLLVRATAMTRTWLPVTTVGDRRTDVTDRTEARSLPNICGSSRSVASPVSKHR